MAPVTASMTPPSVFIFIISPLPFTGEELREGVFRHEGAYAGRFLMRGDPDPRQGPSGKVETDHDAHLAAVSGALGLEGQGPWHPVPFPDEDDEVGVPHAHLFSVLYKVVGRPREDPGDRGALHIHQPLFLDAGLGRVVDAGEAEAADRADR